VEPALKRRAGGSRKPRADVVYELTKKFNGLTSHVARR